MDKTAYQQGQADGAQDVETRYSDEQVAQAERGGAEAARVEVLSWPVEGWETGAQAAGAHSHSAAGRDDRAAYYAGYDAGARAALAALRQPRRPLGLAAGTLQVPADFNAPLPAATEAAFGAQEDEAYGYTFAGWLAAAGRTDSASDYDLRAAWRAGEEPTEYRPHDALEAV